MADGFSDSTAAPAVPDGFSDTEVPAVLVGFAVSSGFPVSVGFSDSTSSPGFSVSDVPAVTAGSFVSAAGAVIFGADDTSGLDVTGCPEAGKAEAAGTDGTAGFTGFFTGAVVVPALALLFALTITLHHSFFFFVV